MMNAPTLALCAGCMTLTAAAQSFNINGLQNGYEGPVKLVPEPVTVGQELRMAELPVTLSPAAFYLNVGTGSRYGPYELADGAVVGSRQASYTLRMFDYGQHFTLHSTSNTNTVYGPFAATNGAPVSLGNTVMTVLRPPPKLTVSLSHPNRIAQTPSIGIAPLNPSVIRGLYELRAKYVGLADRVDFDTASSELQGVPRVHSNITGNSFTPVVRTSVRDRQNALKGAELSAMVFLDKLFAQAFRLRSQAITDGLVFHFQLPEAGEYVLCATQRTKDPSITTSIGSTTVVWWTAFRFDGEHPLSLALTAENAITWRDIFQLSRDK